MWNKNILKPALLNSLVATAYVFLVVLLLNNGEKIFGGGPKSSLLTAMAMLLLLVLSAAFMAVVIFGKPVLMYFDGHKKEAIMTALATLGFLFVIDAAVFIALIFLKIA